MNTISKLTPTLLITLLLLACNNKPKPVVLQITPEKTAIDSINKKSESIEGFYETKPEPNSTGECGISVEIKKGKSGYTYFLKTKLRKVKGIASFTKNESGEKYITLEGIKWDDFEGDISREEESDSLSNSSTKEPEIPVGIDASYVKDTLTIQNYGNSMNSYTKISECDRKYIQLIKK